MSSSENPQKLKTSGSSSSAHGTLSTSTTVISSSTTSVDQSNDAASSNRRKHRIKESTRSRSRSPLGRTPPPITRHPDEATTPPPQAPASHKAPAPKLAVRDRLGYHTSHFEAKKAVDPAASDRIREESSLIRDGDVRIQLNDRREEKSRYRVDQRRTDNSDRYRGLVRAATIACCIYLLSYLVNILRVLHFVPCLTTISPLSHTHSYTCTDTLNFTFTHTYTPSYMHSHPL